MRSRLTQASITDTEYAYGVTGNASVCSGAFGNYWNANYIIGIAQRGTQIDSVETRLDREFAAMRADATKTRVDIMEPIDRLQDRVESMREDITVNYYSDDRAGETIRVMQRQIARLQTGLEKLQDDPGKRPDIAA